VIAHARVPIIRFVSLPALLPMDLTLDFESGEASTALMRGYARALPEFRALVVVLKLWLQRRGLAETYNGGIGSFLLQLMVAALLLLRPLAASRGRVREAAAARADALRGRAGGAAVGAAPAAPAPSPDGTLASGLLDFFELYGVKLNYRQTGLSLRHGGAFFEKRGRPGWLSAERPHLLSIENPLDPSADTARAAFNIGAARRAFGQSYYGLLAAMRDAAEGGGEGGGAGEAGGGGGSGGGAVGARGPCGAAGWSGRRSVLSVIFDSEVDAMLAARLASKYDENGALLQPPIALPPPADAAAAVAPRARAGTAGARRLAGPGSSDDDDDDDEGGARAPPARSLGGSGGHGLKRSAVEAWLDLGAAADDDDDDDAQPGAGAFVAAADSDDDDDDDDEDDGGGGGGGGSSDESDLAAGAGRPAGSAPTPGGGRRAADAGRSAALAHGGGAAAPSAKRARADADGAPPPRAQPGDFKSEVVRARLARAKARRAERKVVRLERERAQKDKNAKRTGEKKRRKQNEAFRTKTLGRAA
jgi:hypothetical protein